MRIHGLVVLEKPYTTGQAAKICGISQNKMIQCFDEGLIKGYRLPGSKFRKIPRDALMEFLRIHSIGSLSKRILVVDRDSSRFERISKHFEGDSRASVQRVTNALKAGYTLGYWLPTAIILDEGMPGISPNEWRDHLQTSPELRNTNLILAEDSEGLEKLLCKQPTCACHPAYNTLIEPYVRIRTRVSSLR